MKRVRLHFSIFNFRFSFFILIVLQSYSPPVIAQQPHDYQLFRQDATYFYHQSDDWYGEVVGIRLDASVQTADGTEWFNHHAIQDVNTDPYAGWCYSPDGPSWMGYKLLVKPTGDNLLYGINKDDLANIFFDTILIKTNATPGDSWEYLHAGSNIGSGALATVIRMDTMTFLGITDSIKVIGLGEDSIILSKDHGLVRALNFRDYFPDSFYSSYELAGISTSDSIIGRRLLTYGEIYDYEIGDVFHRRIYIEGGSYPDVYDVFEVLDKYFSADQDTVFYQMSRIEWWYYIGGLSEINFDTLTESYFNLDEILYDDNFPAETMWFPDSSAVYAYELYYDNAYYNGRMMYHGPHEIFPSPVYPDTCFDMMGADFTTYIEGCGDFTHFYGDYHNCMPCQRLDYFKKGDEEWGIPYEIPVGIGEYEQLEVRIYPVPAEDFVMIEIDKAEIRENLLITLSDLSGRILDRKIVLPDQVPYKLDLQSKENGIYFLGIDSGDKIFAGKIVHFIR
jgi:hypothetical protein